MPSFVRKVNDRISIEAVLSGVALDSVITSIFVFFLSVPFIISVVQQHGTKLDKAELIPILGDQLSTSPFFVPLSLILGCIATVIGGYLAAYLAKRSELLTGFFVGVISCIFAWIERFGFSVDPEYSQYANQIESIESSLFNPSYYWLLVVAMPFVGLLGAYLYLKLREYGIRPTKPRIFERIGLSAIFTGRMGRWAAFGSAVAVFVLYCIGVALLFFATAMIPPTVRPVAFFVEIAIFVILTLGLVVLSYSITVRRLHDIELNGWLGLMSYISYIGTVFVLFEIFWPGTKGANKYGEAHDKFSLVYTLTGKEMK